MTKQVRCEMKKNSYRFHKLFCSLLIALVFGCILCPETVWADNGSTIVHVTATGKCYHRAGCFHLRSDYEITLYEAVVEKGYNPCEDCNPPLYDGPAPLHEKMDKSQSKSSSEKSGKKVSTTNSQTVTKTVVKEKHSMVGYVILAVFSLILGGQLVFLR